MDILRAAVDLPWKREERGKQHVNGYIVNACSSTLGDIWIGICGCGVDWVDETPSST